jgi:hypothetical protein
MAVMTLIPFGNFFFFCHDHHLRFAECAPEANTTTWTGNYS